LVLVLIITIWFALSRAGYDCIITRFYLFLPRNIFSGFSDFYQGTSLVSEIGVISASILASAASCIPPILASCLIQASTSCCIRFSKDTKSEASGSPTGEVPIKEVESNV
jgi:hypothetical protein